MLLTNNLNYLTTFYFYNEIVLCTTYTLQQLRYHYLLYLYESVKSSISCAVIFL